MAQATALPGRRTLFNRDPVNLAVVWNDCWQKANLLRAPGSTLKRIEDILQPVVDVVRSERLLIHVQAHVYFQPVRLLIADTRSLLLLSDESIEPPTPCVPWSLVRRNSDLQ